MTGWQNPLYVRYSNCDNYLSSVKKLVCLSTWKRNASIFNFLQDVIRLTSELPNLFKSYEVPFPKWNHLDFLWAIDANTLLYPEVLKNMEEIRKTVPEWNEN